MSRNRRPSGRVTPKGTANPAKRTAVEAADRPERDARTADPRHLAANQSRKVIPPVSHNRGNR